jgi:hypothetical protein
MLISLLRILYSHPDWTWMNAWAQALALVVSDKIAVVVL